MEITWPSPKLYIYTYRFRAASDVLQSPCSMLPLYTRKTVRCSQYKGMGEPELL